MSFKNRVLLHRTGRSQFGDPGQPPLAPYVPSAKEKAREQEMRALHKTLNAAFIKEHGQTWLAAFDGLAKREAWAKLYPDGRPALSTFLTHGREFASFEDYLLFRLVGNKRKSLVLLGHSKADIDAAMSKFAECGRYYVSWGKSRRTYGSL
ncbi:MAG: hypothetical protein KJ052_00085 [Candidatus Hydrogenedentes bacterium]|nr:hypothetical protein [Candidatus Hydrogenedentota bacterium]